MQPEKSLEEIEDSIRRTDAFLDENAALFEEPVRNEAGIAEHVVVIANVRPTVRVCEIIAHFEWCGSIVSVIIPVCKYTKKLRNCALVEFSSLEECRRAHLLNRTMFQNKMIVVADLQQYVSKSDSGRNRTYAENLHVISNHAP